jgi:hypothetical protein
MLCQDLNIKIAIIKRYYLHNHERIGVMSPMVSALLGVEVSNNLMRYTVNTPKDVIISDISKGLPIALELDNLKLNWD